MLEQRLIRDEYEHRVDKLKKEIEAEIRRRLVADRDIEAMAKTLRKPLPEDVVFTDVLITEEKPVILEKNYLPKPKKIDERGPAFHEKKEKNQKTNQGGSYKKKIKAKYKKPKTRGQKKKGKK